MRNNYALAFVEYCKGTATEEIALILNLPLETLKNKISEESWYRLKSALPTVLPDVVVAPQGEKQLAARAQLLQHNREVNYAGWVELREHALKLIGDLQKGSLSFKRYWHNKGQIVEKVCEPSMADVQAIANYYQMICNGTYLALGDRGATDGSGRTGGDAGGVAAQAPAITIVLPGAVSVPRDQRTEVVITPSVPAQVERPIVDVEEVK